MRSRQCQSSSISRFLEQRRPLHWFAHDDPLRPGDAGLRPELRVAALDQLPEQRTIKTRANGIWSRLELAGRAMERLALPVVLIADINHERGRRRVVDKVIANPLDFPRLAEAAA